MRKYRKKAHNPPASRPARFSCEINNNSFPLSDSVNQSVDFFLASVSRHIRFIDVIASQITQGLSSLGWTSYGRLDWGFLTSEAADGPKSHQFSTVTLNKQVAHSLSRTPLNI